MSRKIDRILGRGKEAPSVEKPVVQHAIKKGFFAVKLMFIGRRGAPDRMFLGPDATIFFIEFKRARKQARPHQSKVHRLLRGMGFEVYVVDTKEKGIEIVDSYT